MAGRLTPLQVTLRYDRVEGADLGGYRRLQLVPTFLDVGRWTIRLPLQHSGAVALLESYRDGDDLARWGVVARHGGNPDVILSGPATDAYLVQDASGSTLTLTGQCDNAVVNGEYASPAPGTDVSTTTPGTLPAAYDVRTGPAETALLGYLAANIGPTAGVVRRRYPWLSIPTSLGRGTTGRWEARWDNLTDLAASICTVGGIGYRVVQGDPGVLQVQTWVPALHSDARFSVTAGNLTRAELVWRAADTTDVVLASDDEAAARNFYRAAAAGPFAYRRTAYLDRRNTTDLTKLAQDAAEALDDGAVTGGMVLTPADLAAVPPGDLLGSRVIGVVAGQDREEVVRQLVITHSGGAGRAEPVSYVASLGVLDPQETTQAEPIVRALARDLTTLTRR